MPGVGSNGEQRDRPNTARIEVVPYLFQLGRFRSIVGLLLKETQAASEVVTLYFLREASKT